MTDDEIQTEGFTRRYVKGRTGYEFLCRANEHMGEMGKAAGRRRAYALAGMEGFAVGTAAAKMGRAA